MRIPKSKEQLARKRQAKTGIEAGLIGAWSCLEGCWSYRACYCAEKGYPQLHRYRTQCKHLYLYFDHKDYGWMNIRLQTWFPYHIQIALNGREWLRRRLEKRGVDFLRQGNKFLHIEDYAVAQRFLNRQLDRRWPHLLNSFLSSAFPSMTQTLGPHLSYYWTLWQSEWATDLIMNTPAELTPTMASILRHAWVTGNSANVLRYLGRPLTSSGKPHAHSNHEVMSRVLDFHDGLRVRHWVDHKAISDPAFTVSGITHAALRQKLCSTNWGVGRTEKQLSARVRRHLRLLRDHGLIRKLPNRHRYHLTDRGRQLTTALNVMLSASTEQLLDIAA